MPDLIVLVWTICYKVNHRATILFISSYTSTLPCLFLQVLQWTLRNATCPVLNLRTILGSDNVRQRGFMTCRLLCSTHNQTSTLHQHTDLSQLQLQPCRELSIRALLDMGFTDTQADQLLEAANKGRGGQSEHASSTLMALFVLGLNPSSVLKVLEKCPELFYVKGTQLQQRMDNLRRLGLLEGERINLCWHSILIGCTV